MKRRDLLIGSAALATGLCASRAIASRPRRILVLGGTNFVGPAIVERAIARGHQVTLFNRGRTNPHLFERLELLVGDRQPDSSAGLGALEGDRRWDAVVDVWPDNVALVGPTARMLRDRTDYYFFVSSVAVYASFDRPGLDETTPLKQSGTGYGARKAAAEALLGSLFGVAVAGRHLWIQSLPADQVPSCGPPLDYLFSAFPFAKVLQLVFTGSGECAKVEPILGLPMPAWTLLWFIALAALAVVATCRPVQKK